MSYNGWRNWETWNVALWCDNDEGIYRERMRAKPRTADDCESFVREYFPHGTPDMLENYTDFDPYCKRDAVDWEEIASHWSEDYEDNVTSFDATNPLSDEEAREERI